MNNRSCLWLLSIASLSLAPQAATAQTIRSVQGGSQSFIRIPGSKESHRELPDGPDMNAGQEMMADRLKELHELHQLQDQVQGLLKDPDFANNVKNNFSEDQLRRLREKILKGDGLGRDGNWNKLLQQAGNGHKFDERQLDILRRWAERSNANPTTPQIGSSLMNLRPTSSSAPNSTPSSPSGASPSPSSSFMERLQGGTSEWVTKHMDGLGGDLVGALNELGDSEDGAPLAELLRSMNRSDFSGGEFAEQAAGLSSYMPNLAEFVHEQRGAWDELRSMFGDVDAPSMPSLGGGPALRTVTSTDGESWGGASFALVALGVLFLLLWKLGGSSGWKALRGEDGQWRLGPWPVQPAAVATRQELIRAFEYLALLRLGVTAGTCHHRTLAGRLAERDEGDPARRRHAVELLADLYEQSRYAPGEEPLSPEELSEARHALCFLAGVTIA